MPQNHTPSQTNVGTPAQLRQSLGWVPPRQAVGSSGGGVDVSGGPSPVVSLTPIATGQFLGNLTGSTTAPIATAFTFLNLTDTPSAYTSQALKAVRVNAGATALEFYTAAAGTVTSVGATSANGALTISGSPITTSGSFTFTVNSAPIWTTARTLSFTGDATGSGSVDGSANVATALILATVNSNVGSFGDATHIPTLTVNAKGLVTAASQSAITVPAAANPTASVGPSAVNGSAATFMRSDAAPALANTAVTAGSYTAASLTVDAQGRLTAASSGTAAPSAANPTASVGLSAVNGSAATFLRSDGAPALDVTIAPTWSAKHTWSVAGAASAPGALWTGAIFTGGTGTTTFPHVLIQPSTATVSTGWSTTGTAFGINVHAGITNFMDLRLDGVQKFKVASDGQMLSSSINVLDIISTSGNVTGGTSQWRLNGSANTLQLYNAGTISWSSTNLWFGTNDLFLTRKTAATLQLGAADAAVAVAQSLSAQSVVAGTSNTAGANWTLKASQGTGTGVGGDIIFQTAKAGTTGTAQNALATAFTVSNLGMPVVPSGTVAQLPANSIGGLFVVTDSTTTAILGLGLSPTGGGANIVLCFNTGAAWIQL